jgi:hypothetical protein
LTERLSFSTTRIGRKAAPFVVHLSSSASRNQAALYALREGIAALDDGDE